MSQKDKNQEKHNEEEKDIQDQVQEQDGVLEQDASDEKASDALAEVQKQLEGEKERNLRLFAEFENYKKRTARERIEMFKTAGEDIMISLLPVLDDFERALKELEKSEDDGLFTGVKLINNKLRETLRSKGLEAMEVKPGDDFDSDTQEAVTQIPAPEKKLKGKVIDVVDRGYTLGDKIIRYPKVVIGK